MSSSDNFADVVGTILEGLLAARNNPANEYSLDGGERQRPGNVAGIWSDSDWLVRVDRPHRNVDFHHININSRVTGVPDPHVRISETTANAIGNACNTAKAISNNVGYATAAVDAYRLGKAFCNDMEKGDGSMEETKKAATSMAGGYVGATCGAYAGSAVGSKVGELIGELGGPGGADVLGAIGSMVGEVLGGVVGAEVGRELAKESYNGSKSSSY